MTILILFLFDTGDSDGYVEEIPVVVFNCDDESVHEIEDSMCSYIDTVASEDLEFQDYVSDVMEESGFKYSFIPKNVPACDKFVTIRI